MSDPKQLVSVYKKNGSFDKRRKKLLDNFKESETHANLMLKLRMIVEGKVKSDPSILMKNRGKIGALIQGNIIQQKNETENSILNIVDKDIQEKIIDSPEFHDILKDELKDIERRLLGISDEEWETKKKEEAEEKLLRSDTPSDLPQSPVTSGSTVPVALSASSTFGAYKLKPAKVVKAPKINLSQLKY